MRIGLLEDDVSLVEIMSLWIEDGGNHVVSYTTGKSFREGILNEKIDVLVLDWNLPDTNGLNELDWLRGEIGSEVPVIFITSRDDEDSLVEALNHGADDYMTKPVHREVVLARINALHRRSGYKSSINKQDSGVYVDNVDTDIVEVYEPYEINQSQRKIFNAGDDVKLTKKEFDLAAFMFRNEASLVSRDYLLENIWGTRADINTRTVDTHICRIRTKLGFNEDIGWQLNSIYQCGYRLLRLH